MPELSRQFALQDHNGGLLHYVAEATELRAVEAVSKVLLQIHPDNSKAATIVSSHCGIALPNNPLQATSSEPQVFWRAPGEWLIVGDQASVETYQASLSSVPTGQAAIATDVSDSLVVIEIQGRGMIAILEESCGVDLHSDVFSKGKYALTRFAHLPILIHKVGNTSGMHLYIDRSVARYVWDWLKDGIEKTGACGN